MKYETVADIIAERDALKARLAEWDKAAAFYRRCKADPRSHEVGAMKDAVDWLCSIAARAADSAPAAMSAEEHCKMFCAWKGGGPCLAADCPRRKEDSAPVGRECQTLAALDSEDAARFRWLCDDHADKAVRHLRDSLLERMSMMSLSAVRAAIGTHLSNMSEQAKAKNSHHE